MAVVASAVRRTFSLMDVMVARDTHGVGPPGWRLCTPAGDVRPAGRAEPSIPRAQPPITRAMSFDLHFCLGYLIEKGGSDLHLKVPAPPVIRVDGQMRPIDGLSPLTPEDTERAVREMLSDADKLQEFAE